MDHQPGPRHDCPRCLINWGLAAFLTITCLTMVVALITPS